MKKLKILFFVLISLFFISEIYLRVFHYETLKKFKRDLAYIPDPLYGYRYEANSEQEFIWPDINKKFKFNNQGFYGPDFSKIKKPGSYRIAFVGNSVTLGIRSDGDDNFVMKLQDLFNQANYNIEVINCSVDGKDNDLGNLNRIKYQVTEFNPDLILYQYVFPFKKKKIVRGVYRDIMLKYKYDMRDSLPKLYSEIDKVYSAKVLTKIYDYSYNVRALCRWMLHNKKTKFSNFFNENILGIKWIYIYVTRGKNWGKWNNESFTTSESYNMYLDVKRHLDSLNIQFATFDLGPKPEKFYPINPDFNLDIKWKKELILPNEGHPNDKAQKLIAEKMFNLLINSSIPLDKYKRN